MAIPYHVHWHRGWLKILDKYAPIQGKTLLDVGCGDGEFIVEAKKAGAREAWGVDYHPQNFIDMQETQGLTAEDKARCLQIPFSQLLLKRPDLKGTFDVVKITAITSYADAEELTAMMPTAHALLKKDGHLVMDLPQFNMAGKAFQANQDPEAHSDVIANHQYNARDKHEAKRLASAYRRLVNAYFNKTKEIEGPNGLKVLVAAQPKEQEIVPQPHEIYFNPQTLILSPMPGEISYVPPKH